MHNATQGWLKDLADVALSGKGVAPRGQATLEVVGHRSTPVDMRFPVVCSPARKLGYKFMAAEAAWILSGDDRVETIASYSKEISKFSDDGHRFFGAYGPKIRYQLDYVVECLVSDKVSRQAVVNIWRENPPKTKDVPCTLSTQFLIRDDELHCVDTMRSSDLWLGHPYDVFNFSMISLAVCVKLRTRGVYVSPGTLFLNSGSKHIYLRNLEGVREVLSTMSYPGPRISTVPFDSVDTLVKFLWDRANDGNIAEQESWHV